MIFLFKYWKYIAVALAVLSVLGALWYYGHTKYREGYNACVSVQEKANVEGIKNREKTNQKLIRLPDTDLDKRFDKWLLP